MRPFDLDRAIRKVPGFPKPGILFYDITSVLTDPDAFAHCVDSALERYRVRALDAVVAVESRGFLFASPIARELRLPLVLIRKRGKLPGPTWSRCYDLEYGQDCVEVHRSDLQPGQRLLVVDDLAATGGTLKATCDLAAEIGCAVEEIFCVIGLPFLGFRERVAPVTVTTLIDYENE